MKIESIGQAGFNQMKKLEVDSNIRRRGVSEVYRVSAKRVAMAPKRKKYEKADDGDSSEPDQFLVNKGTAAKRPRKSRDDGDSSSSDDIGSVLNLESFGNTKCAATGKKEKGTPTKASKGEPDEDEDEEDDDEQEGSDDDEPTKAGGKSKAKRGKRGSPNAKVSRKIKATDARKEASLVSNEVGGSFKERI